MFDLQLGGMGTHWQQTTRAFRTGLLSSRTDCGEGESAPLTPRRKVSREYYARGLAGFNAPAAPERSYSVCVNATRVVEPPGPGCSVMRIAATGATKGSRRAK